MSRRSGKFDAVEQRAAMWLSRRDAGMNEAELVEFDRWLAADPRHAAAVEEIDAVWSAFDRSSPPDRPETFRTRMTALRRRDRLHWIGAGTVTVAAACFAVFFSLQRIPERTPTAAVATARISEPTRQTLPDGSIVEFKTGAGIAVAFSEDVRRVILSNGEAHFTVMKNPQRPFIVEAGMIEVRAVGTAFAVQLDGAAVDVLVTEGKVDVASQPGVPEPISKISGKESAPTRVGAGQQASIKMGGQDDAPVVVVIPEKEMVERLSWRVPSLEFSQTSVAEAIGLFNSYGKLHLRTADDGVGALRVTGVFRSDNPDGFARALEETLGIEVEFRSDEIFLRRR